MRLLERAKSPESMATTEQDLPHQSSAEPQKIKVTRAPDRTRRRILEAAREEFCERGLQGARVDSIAERADINKRMLYHYFGNKNDLYCEVLLQAYAEIRSNERRLKLESANPSEGMAELVRFTFRHFMSHPWFVRLLITENMNGASNLRKVATIKDLHSPLVSQITDLLRRGTENGEFHDNIDAIELYITIAALGFFYLSNNHTLSQIFGEDLSKRSRVKRREDHIVEVVLAYVRV